MRNYVSKFFRVAASLLMVVLLAAGSIPQVRAAIPYLQVVTTDNTNYQVVVSGGDPYRVVDFYTRQSDTELWTVFSNIGTTDSAGYLTTQVATGSYSPGRSRESYVTVGGVASSSVFTGFGSSAATITFSQSTVYVGVGQSTVVTAYGSSNYYVSNNSNLSVASATVSGSSITVYGNAAGSTTLTVCGATTYPYYTSNCETLYVTVSGTTSGTIWFNPSNPTMYVGQSLAVAINSGSTGYAYPTYSNSYYVSSNSNPNVVSATISGTVLNLYANNSGSSSVTVTHSSLGWSATLFVTVSGSTSSTITFSNANPTLQIGQTTTVSIYSPTNSYGNNFYVSSNSSPHVVSATVSGQQLTLYGLASGSSSITLSQYSTQASGTLYVTVAGYGTSSMYANGQLINQYGTIYIVYKNTISAFSNASAFLGLGFNFANALAVGYTNIPTSGYIITTQYAAHPWGSWVKSGSTVYFVHQDGLIPISSYDIFLNNGGRSELLVPMNGYDWQRPQLSLMAYGDYRMK